VKKIPTLFERDWTGDRSRVVDQVHPGCEWVLAGEGIATRKIDGTSCEIHQGGLWKRRELKPGEAAPPGFRLADRDETTGKSVGWLPVDTQAPEDRYHREAFARLADRQDGTYELIGPRIQGNPEGESQHVLVRHDPAALALAEPVPRSFDGLRAYLTDADIEGIVWHHPNGSRAKLKKRDFGLKR
jgi:hypothetical protein